uniref:Uncharacterized protein n=1 Tax=Anguilla anguilla TaxID=7936 RepID=A0A0E9S511_ANGAN
MKKGEEREKGGAGSLLQCSIHRTSETLNIDSFTTAN